MIMRLAKPLTLVVAVVLGAQLSGSFLVGCATARSAAAGATGGVTLRLYKHDQEGGAMTLYEMKRDGTLGFGGGRDAQFDRITWTGAMTEPEIEELLALIEQYEWFESGPDGSDEPQGLSYRISLSGPKGSKRYRIKGSCESLIAIETLLERISRRRLEPILDKLPKPSSSN